MHYAAQLAGLQVWRGWYPSRSGENAWHHLPLSDWSQGGTLPTTAARRHSDGFHCSLQRQVCHSRDRFRLCSPHRTNEEEAHAADIQIQMRHHNMHPHSAIASVMTAEACHTCLACPHAHRLAVSMATRSRIPLQAGAWKQTTRVMTVHFQYAASSIIPFRKPEIFESVSARPCFNREAADLTVDVSRS